VKKGSFDGQDKKTCTKRNKRIHVGDNGPELGKFQKGVAAGCKKLVRAPKGMRLGEPGRGDTFPAATLE